MDDVIVSGRAGVPGYRISRPKSDQGRTEPDSEDGALALCGPDDSLFASARGSMVSLYRLEDFGKERAEPIATAKIEAVPTRLWTGGLRGPLTLFALDAEGRLHRADF